MISYSIVIDLNDRYLNLTDRVQFGGVPVILEISTISDSVSFTIEDTGLDYCGFYINRSLCIYELNENAVDITDGKLVFKGDILSEPSFSNGELSFSCGQPQIKDIYLPSNGYINNKMIPDIFGTVPDVEMIPNNIPFVTELAQDANAEDLSLRVKDATGLTASGIVVVDGREYSYSSKTDNLLFIGIDVNDVVREGTAVAQKGIAEYVGAGHALQAMDNIKLDGSITLQGQKDLNNATITFDSVPTTIRAKGIESILAEFDEVDVSNTSTDAINAIRATTGTFNQSGTTFTFGTGAEELTRNANIDFPAPPQDKIIQGTYSISVSVNANGNTGDAEVSVGGQIVWVLRSGVAVYNPGTITFFNNNVSNQMSVSIKRNVIPQSIDVTIISADRTINVGNLDASAYATITNSKNFVVNQLTDMPIRGRITKAQIAIEWFATDEKEGTANVIFDGATLGQLNQDNVSGQSDNLNITTDTISSGTATLLSNEVSGISSNAAQKSDLTKAVTANMILSYIAMKTDVFGAGTLVSNSPLNTKLTLPPGVKAGNYTFKILFQPKDTSIASTPSDGWLYVNGTRFTILPTQNGEYSATVFIAANTTKVTLYHSIEGTPEGYTWAQGAGAAGWLMAMAQSISVDLLILPTADTIEVSGGGFTGDPIITNTTAPNAGVNVQTTINGATGITITVPAPPRTVINFFDLTFREWSDFTDKQLKISYSSTGSEQIAIVRALVAIDYDVNINVPVSRVSASLSGSSGNPADIIRDLTALTGQEIDQSDFQLLKELSEARNYNLARVVDTKSDVLQLLSYVLNQSSVYYYNGKFKYWFTNDTNITTLTEDDLFSPISYNWSGEVYTAVNLKYQFINGDFVKSISANANNNNICLITEQEILEKREIDLDCKWIQEDAVAALYLEDFVNRFCKMRRLITFELPFTFDFLEVNCVIGMEDCLYKILNVQSNDGWITLQTEELKQ